MSNQREHVMKFEPGKKISILVKTLLPLYNGYAPPYRIEGVVYPSEKYDPPCTIRVYTGKWYHPVSVVHLHNIIEDESEKNVSKNEGKDEKKVFTVKGSKGNEYKVVLEENRVYCNCVGFQYRRRCKHADEVLKNIEIAREFLL